MAQAAEPTIIVGDEPFRYTPVTEPGRGRSLESRITQGAIVRSQAGTIHGLRTAETSTGFTYPRPKRSPDIPNRPFGDEHAIQRPGLIRPSTPRGQLLEATRQFYLQWKTRYVRSSGGRAYVFVNPENSSDSGFDPDTLTVSEAHGYGMMITAYMAGTDMDARKTFDEMYRFFKDHPSVLDSRLMAWRVTKDGKVPSDGDSATDGDMDIAYALLLAHEQWGSNGSINYLEAARNILAGIREKAIHPTANTILLGDWASTLSSNDRLRQAMRTSDYMPDHFRVFEKADNSPVWGRVINKSQQLFQTIQDRFSPQTGFIPDFIEDAAGTNPRPPTGELLEGSDDGAYSYNASRVPMRLGIDFMTSGDPTSLAILQKLNAGIRAVTNNDPSRIRAGYQLNGTVLNSWSDMAFTAPLAVSAMASGSQAWMDGLWREVVNTPLSSQSYFGNTLKMISMLGISGAYWTPGSTPLFPRSSDDGYPRN